MTDVSKSVLLGSIAYMIAQSLYVQHALARIILTTVKAIESRVLLFLQTL
jgi:hypothetical protein